MSMAAHWISFWGLQQPGIEFMAQENLPGRDLAWSGIYFYGKLVTSFARQRLEYLYPHLTPTGLTGTPTIAQIVHDEEVNATAEAAVRSVTEAPHGIMSVDLREDYNGIPRPTEINAGRSFTTMGLWSLWDDEHNFTEIAAALAMVGAEGKQIIHMGQEWQQRDALPEGLILTRHIDCGYQMRLP